MDQAATSTPILNRVVPRPPWDEPRTRRLPGISPLDMEDWIWVLDSYPGQMAERERLLYSVPDLVHALPADAMPAALELYDFVVAQLLERTDFRKEDEYMRCPDGRRVHLDRSAPLLTLARLVQEDLCLLLKPSGGKEHLLAAAVLCFPASWTLAEKLGRPMTAIHGPVAAYDDALSRRVQRLLDGVQPNRPLWRANMLWYHEPALFQPRSERDSQRVDAESATFLRSERQCLFRLPESNAVVFSIHTIVMERGAVAKHR
ncbi:heme-dependent oxidative N-demethylase family protein [Tropicimonas marinistellae]|uniref:heme-dependent oxidative N-demethylase family protein n=1 Tax=Tropicimonas marinistellae TaxID=1739787 RepID=UPI00082F5415|nr:DUF3445 domain-containing protein [Tropicimonas marinistellae]